MSVPAFGGSAPSAMERATVVDELLLDRSAHQRAAGQVLDASVVALPGGLGQRDVVGRHLLAFSAPVPLANSDPPPTARRS